MLRKSEMYLQNSSIIIVRTKNISNSDQNHKNLLIFHILCSVTLFRCILLILKKMDDAIVYALDITVR